VFLKNLGIVAGSAGVLSVLPERCCLGQTPPGVKRGTSILFMMTDDHAAHAMSCYGSRVNKTPNLDRIAKEGMRFSNCFCTNSICAPSRAVILTGKYSHVNGVIDNAVKFDGTQQTFPKLLQQVGYETAIIGKWHLKTDPTGFDYWNILPGQGVYYNPVTIEMGERKKHQGYATDIIADQALNWLRTRKGDKPFCLLLQHKAPHRNWQKAGAAPRKSRI
jgi:arylsulfatase A-like enzyme